MVLWFLAAKGSLNHRSEFCKNSFYDNTHFKNVHYDNGRMMIAAWNKEAENRHCKNGSMRMHGMILYIINLENLK